MPGSYQMMNLFGFQVDGMDIDGFLALPRLTFVVLVLIGAAILARGAGDGLRSRLVLGLAAVGHLLAWFATMFPLGNVYGANGSMDRENHLGWANVVASGFSPLYTSQVNHLHFEPLWPLLAGLASGFNPDRVYAFFMWTPLIVGLALLWSVHTAWSRIEEERGSMGTGAAFAALGALLLMAAPGDFSGPFRNPWALTFLLKPNHALGLVLVPLAILAIARANSWKSRLFAGFILQLVGWAFVIHMVLVVAGLAVFVALAWLERRRDRVTDLIDVGTAVGVNLLIVSPYLLMLVVAYPFLEGNVPNTLPPLSERPIEAPLRMGVLFLLGAFGAWNAHRGGHRLARMFASQWLAAQLIWQLFPLLGLIGQAREQDEAFYWCRFWSGLFAGFGVWRLSLVILDRLRIGRLWTGERLHGTAATLSLIFLLPSLVPSWWDPKTMDQYFVAALEPLPDWIAEPTRFIRTRTPREAVFAGDRNYARWVGAYGARRVLLSNALNLPNDHVRRKEIEQALFRSGPEALRIEGRDRYSIQYLLVTSRPLEQDRELTLDQLKSLPYLETVYDRDFLSARVVILKVLAAGAPHDRQ
ncbi:MAG: hypothetical protein KA385_02195 [Vicinamibacteria bacterium]|nr:hypothetical protein [Vicinamibacteria bacterium]